MWDFDSAFGVRTNSADLTSPEGIYFTGEREAWFMDCPAVSEKYEEAVREELIPLMHEFLSGDSSRIATFAQIEAGLAGSQKMNQVLWGLATYSDWIAPEPTYAGNMDYLEGWLRDRTEWFEEYMGQASVE